MDEHFGHLLLELCDRDLSAHVEIIREGGGGDVETTTRGLMSGIIQGMNHVHTSLLSDGERAYHADVHPGNILIKERQDGSVVAKISDFGLSKVLDSTQSSTIMTRARPNGEGWVAPEVLRNGELGSRADGW